jgi:transposase
VRAPVLSGRRRPTHIDALIATLEHRLSNALVEAVNTRIRLIIRRANGFHSASPLIALAMLSCGDCRPTLPGRAA